MADGKAVSEDRRYTLQALGLVGPPAILAPCGGSANLARTVSLSAGSTGNGQWMQHVPGPPGQAAPSTGLQPPGLFFLGPLSGSIFLTSHQIHNTPITRALPPDMGPNGGNRPKIPPGPSRFPRRLAAQRTSHSTRPRSVSRRTLGRQAAIRTAYVLCDATGRVVTERTLCCLE